MLKNNANPNVSNEKALTSLDIATYKSFHETVELLIKAGAKPILVKGVNGMTKLYYAVLYSNMKEIETLLSQGANINARNDRGQTPLHIVVINNNGEVCDLLLERGALPNQPDFNNNSPLQIAYDNKYENIYENLLACSLTDTI